MRPKTRETAPASTGSCLRRSRHDRATSPSAAACLQMLKVIVPPGMPRLRNRDQPDRRRRAAGRVGPDHEPRSHPRERRRVRGDPGSTQTLSTVFLEGLAAGGARFRRLEGCWYGNRRIFFISTNGGNRGFGQVWEFDIRRSTLTLLVESPNHDVFDGPDNVCVTPQGGLVFCEDAAGAQFLRGVSRSGEVFPLARNLRNSIEFAGACFSPDGRTLFANLYGRSTERTTLAVSGARCRFRSVRRSTNAPPPSPSGDRGARVRCKAQVI